MPHQHRQPCITSMWAIGSAPQLSHGSWSSHQCWMLVIAVRLQMMLGPGSELEACLCQTFTHIGLRCSSSSSNRTYSGSSSRGTNPLQVPAAAAALPQQQLPLHRHNPRLHHSNPQPQKALSLCRPSARVLHAPTAPRQCSCRTTPSKDGVLLRLRHCPLAGCFSLLTQVGVWKKGAGGQLCLPTKALKGGGLWERVGWAMASGGH